MSAAMIIAGILQIIPSIFKHKPFVLFYWNGQKWEQKGGTMSSRQCRHQKAALVSIGMNEHCFVILRKGVEPPPFGPPPQKDEK